MDAIELINTLKEIITLYDDARSRYAEAFTRDKGKGLSNRYWEDVQRASRNLIIFWSEHRDRIKFMVWDGEEAPGFDVIRGWPATEQEA
jgi:hypothetical protein